MPAPHSGLVAIFPGSFDPLTNGHLDLVARGSRLANKLLIAVLNNTHKQALFSPEERMEMIREATSGFPNVETETFDGLLVDFAARSGANVILRGIRAISDYETELQMALINRRLRPGTETMFLLAREEFSFISSRLIKEVITLGGDVSSFVPPNVADRLRTKYARSK